jgi:hypothetical protein
MPLEYLFLLFLLEEQKIFIPSWRSLAVCFAIEHGARINMDGLKLKKSFMRVTIDEEEYIVRREVGELVLECKRFRFIGEGRSPDDLLDYIKALHKKLYGEYNDDGALSYRRF